MTRLHSTVSAELTTRWRLRDAVLLVGTQHLVRWPSAARLGPNAVAAVRAAATAEVAEYPEELSVLHENGWVERRVYAGTHRLYSVVPTAAPAPPADRGARPTGAVLSRFATITRSAGRMVVSSPRAAHHLAINSARLVGMLADPRTAEDSEENAMLANDAWRCGLLVAADDTERQDLPTAQWKPHELTFHHDSRMRGQQLGVGFGATGWARGQFPEPARRRPAFDGERFALARPIESDPAYTESLFDVIDRRRSIRTYDEDRPITSIDLGVFLDRCAAVHGAGPPYPAGGALYELEVYVLARAVTGLDAGLYHYDPEAHALTGVPARKPTVEALLRTAATAMAGEATPQVVLIISARFERLMWKYESIGYALVLKHVGVLLQSMYLVATAMGLAPCALGTGDSALFARAIGTPEHVESSVGEFALGSCVRAEGRL